MKKVLFILALLCLSNIGFAETVVLDTGRVIEGQIFEVTEDYIRMYSDGEILKLRFRNMSIDSEERYRGYTPKPFDPSAMEVEKPPVAPPAKTFDDYVREGLGFAGEGKFKEAIKDFNEAIDIYNDVWDVYLFRAGAYQEAGDLDKAIEDYTTFINRNPSNAEAYARRGWVYKLKGDNKKTISDYSKVLELDPRNFEVLMERYNLYKEEGQWWKAKEDIDYIIALNPDEGAAYVDQAFLNYRIGRYYDAWKSVYEAGKRKVKVPPDFIRELKGKMEDPFFSERKEDSPGFLKQAKDLFIEHIAFVISVGVVIALGIIIMVWPSRKESIAVDPLAQAIEDEEHMLRMVSFKRASLAKRFCAGAIDLVVLSVLAWVAQLMTTPDIFSAVLGGLFLFRDSFGGVSLGKSMVGLRVIDEHGYPAVFLQGFIRNFSFALPIIVFYILFWGSQFILDLTGQLVLLGAAAFFLLEGIFIFVSKNNGRRIGDRMAGTFVHDLYPKRRAWPFAIAGTLILLGYCAGMIILNMTFHKAFLYRLNPMRYYNIERDFSFRIPHGWKMVSEGDGGIVLEWPDLEGSILLIFNEDVKDYSLELCVSAFTQSIKDSGLELKREEEITVAGRPAAKIGFIDEQTNSGLMLIYFKKEDWGDLYMMQVSSPKKNMRRVMGTAVDLVESFQFE